jgi:hypothetical protein
MEAAVMLLRPLLAALTAAPLAAAAALAADEMPIRPGYWESVNRITAVIPIKKTTERRCITPAEVQKFIMGPENHIYRCEYPLRVVEGGQMRFKGTCSSRKGRHVEIEAQGSYTPTSFTLVSEIDTVYAGVPLGGKVTTRARRLGDVCPPPDPEKKKK